MSVASPELPPEPLCDPVFLHARREAIVVFCTWLAALAWSVPYCYGNGYYTEPGGFDPETFHLMWGLPEWVVWGLVVPWLAANVFTVWFCFGYMVDDDLGEAHEGADVVQDRAEAHAAESPPAWEETA